MKKKDKAERCLHKGDCLSRLMLPHKKELRFYYRVDSQNIIQSFEIVLLMKKGGKMVWVSSICVPHRQIEQFFKTIERLKLRIEKKMVSPHEPDVTHLLHK